MTLVGRTPPGPRPTPSSAWWESALSSNSGTRGSRADRGSAPPMLFHQSEHKDIRPRRQGDVLLVVEDVRHRRRPNRLAGLEAPQRFSVGAVGGQYGAAVLAEEN